MKLVLLIFTFVFLGCSSVMKYESSQAASPGGIKVAMGSKDGIHVNDKFAVLERKCIERTRVPLCDFEVIGNMTVSQVFETYSLVVPDENIVFKENYYFKFAKHGGKEE